jgi:virginiamycin B lyase
VLHALYRALGLLVPLLLGFGLLAARALASEFQRYPIGDMGSISSPLRGPDGALWFTGDPGVGRLGPDGKVRLFARSVSPDGFAVGPDGNLWLTDGSRPAVVRLTPEGGLTRFTAGLPKGVSPGRMTTGPDGALWFIEDVNLADGGTLGRLARITTTGQITQFPILRDPDVDDTYLHALVGAPDGRLWFMDAYRVGYMTVSGEVRWLPLATDSESLDGSMTIGPDGDIWVAGLVDEALLRIAPATQAVTSIKAPFASEQIAFNPDGTLWVGGFEPLTRIAQDGTVLERSHDPLGDDDDCDGYASAPGDGFAVDTAGQLWSADLLGSSLVRVTSAAGAPAGPVTPVLPNRGDLKQPQALATGPDGTIWVATARALVRVPPAGRAEVVRRLRATAVQDLAVGGNGTVWFTATHARIGRLDPRGHLRWNRLQLGRHDSLAGIAIDSHGDPWFVEDGRRRIAHRTRSGRVLSYARGIPPDSRLLDIAAGSGGAMWFTDQRGRIGRITRRGRVDMFRSGAARRREPTAITRGPDGAMWFTDFRGRVSRISSHGRVREVKVNESPTAITAGTDGALWFTTAQRDFAAGLGRVTPDGHVSHYHVHHTCETTPWNITAAPDGGIWFGELHGPVALARFNPTAAP